MMESYIEALFLVDDKKMSNLMNYLQSSDLLTDEPETEAQVVLTTVHKAKGKEFDNVIYIPAQTGRRSNFQDLVVEAILKSKGIDAEEELEEETLRINFVAFSRAKENLYVLTDKVSDYLNDYSESTRLETVAPENIDFGESKKKAYTLFVNKDFERAKELLESKKSWLFDFVKRYFDSLDRISFSSLPKNAYDYLVDRVLGIMEYSPALARGSDLHKAAEQILKGEEHEAGDELIPLVENVKKLLGVIQKDYPEVFQTEEFFSIPINQITRSDQQINFNGKIDAVFKNDGQYLIVDWKTDRNNSYASKHRQQLESYKRSFSALNGLSPESVKVAIGYVGLRGAINIGEIDAELDMRQPGRTAFDTFMTRVHKILEWKDNPKLFFQDLLKQKKNYYRDALWRSVVEQYRKETERN
jgi:DNA helicase-2/ATP-dependent DNA helicase PcrA